MATSPPAHALLRAARVAKDLSLVEAVELSTQFGYATSPSNLAKIERGEQAIDPRDAARLARALELDPVKVALRLAEVGDEEGARGGDFEAARRQQAESIPRRAKSIEVAATIWPNGDLAIERTWFQAGPRPNGSDLRELVITDRSKTHTLGSASGMVVVNAPSGVKHQLMTERVAEGWRYILRFPDGWRRCLPEEGFTLSTSTTLHGAYRPSGIDVYPADAGFSQRLTWHVESFILRVKFLCPWEPRLEPWAWWDQDKLENILARACRSSAMETTADGVILTLDRPLAGHSFGLMWSPVDHKHQGEGGTTCVLGYQQPS